MEKFGFFSSIENDRLYTAKDFTSYFARFLTDGIFDVNNNALKVSANGSLDITVAPGVMWIKGHVYELTEPKTLTIDAEGASNRKDRVIVRLDYVNREIRTIIKKGTSSANAAPEELQRDEDAYEMCIAQIELSKGITAIQQVNIVDTRKDLELCGEVSSLLESRTLLDFCQKTGFTMEGTINSKDIMPVGDANIGSTSNRFNTIFCNELDVKNKLPYLPITGGMLEGTVQVDDVLPYLNNVFRLGAEGQRFLEVVAKNIVADNYYGNSTFNGDGAFTVNNPTANFKELKSTSLSINNHQVFIQTDAPANAKAGDVWIQV